MSENKKIKFKDLFNCHIKYFDYLVSKSLIAQMPFEFHFYSKKP